jgi:hypothetical protein
MYDEREQHGWREWLALSNNLFGLIGLIAFLSSPLLFLAQRPILAVAALCLSLPCLFFFVSGYVFKSNNSPITSIGEILSNTPRALEERPRPGAGAGVSPPRRELQLTSTGAAARESEAAAPVETTAARTIESVTASDLIDFFEGFTPSQAEKLTKPYLGKWIKASGEVASMRLNGGGVEILVRQLPNPNRMLHTYFPGYHAVKRYEKLRNNETITFTGEVKGVNRRTVSLDNCVFVDEESPAVT